jgi:hypothetical protein
MEAPNKNYCDPSENCPECQGIGMINGCPVCGGRDNPPPDDECQCNGRYVRRCKACEAVV